jgi:small subunit ribosomal protein S7
MRKHTVKRRELLPDPKYNDVLVSRFVNCLMWDGKRSVAYKIFYGMIDFVGKKTGEDGFDIWKKALDNVYPSVEVKRRRLGGSTLQIPVEVYPYRKISLGIKWIIEQARKRSEKTMVERLSNEIIAASQGEGKAVKKRIDMNKMAHSNRSSAYLNI